MEDPWNFVGHDNVLAALDPVVPTFRGPEQLVVLGTRPPQVYGWRTGFRASWMVPQRRLGRVLRIAFLTLGGNADRGKQAGGLLVVDVRAEVAGPDIW